MKCWVSELSVQWFLSLCSFSFLFFLFFVCLFLFFLCFFRFFSSSWWRTPRRLWGECQRWHRTEPLWRRTWAPQQTPEWPQARRSPPCGIPGPGRSASRRWASRAPSPHTSLSCAWAEWRSNSRHPAHHPRTAPLPAAQLGDCKL